jgi:hypothetical protein
MAADIARRLLPTYNAQHAHAKRVVDQANENGREARRVAERLAGIFGGAIRGGVARETGTRNPVHVTNVPQAVHRLQVAPAYSSTVSVDEMYSSPVRVRFEVYDLDPETAARVLQIIHEAEQTTEHAAVRVAPLPLLQEPVHTHVLEDLPEPASPARMRLGT